MSLHVRTLGQGPALLLIHGWGMHGAIWGEAADELAKRYRVYVVDLPGMGHSAPDEPYDAIALVNRLLSVTDEPVTVCGWSLGGILAMHMALQSPERVARLILVGATPKFVKSSDWSCAMAGDIFQKFAAQVSDEYHTTMQRFLALQAFGNASAKTLLKQLREKFIAGPLPDPKALKHGLEMLLETDVRLQVASLGQPTLLIHGDRDTLVPIGAARWMAKQLSQAHLAEIHGASHAPFLSHPAHFVTAIHRFMES